MAALAASWRPVRYGGERYPDYQVNRAGEVRTCRPGRGRPRIDVQRAEWRHVRPHGGYVRITLRVGSPPVRARISTLVHNAFTPSAQRKLWQGKGEQAANSKLRARDVRRIVALAANTPGNVIAVDFEISAAQVSRIVTGKSWAHVTRPKGLAKVLP